MGANAVVQALAGLVSMLSSMGIMFGGVLPYVAQYRALGVRPSASSVPPSSAAAHASSGSSATHRGRAGGGAAGAESSAGTGFSTYVCLILLVSNIARIHFWFVAGFETALLVQSVVMVAAQLLLLKRCVEHPDRPGPLLRVSLSDMRLRDCWKWTEFSDYVAALAVFSFALAAWTLVLGTHAWFKEALGYFALTTEAVLALPQVYSNRVRRSTRGVSPWLILGWAGGDAFKLLYYVVRRVPVQFFVCGCLQLAVDFVILGQTKLYGDGVPPKGDPPRSRQPVLDVLDALSALRLPSPPKPVSDGEEAASPLAASLGGARLVNGAASAGTASPALSGGGRGGNAGTDGITVVTAGDTSSNSDDDDPTSAGTRESRPLLSWRARQ